MTNFAAKSVPTVSAETAKALTELEPSQQQEVADAAAAGVVVFRHNRVARYAVGEFISENHIFAIPVDRVDEFQGILASHPPVEQAAITVYGRPVETEPALTRGIDNTANSVGPAGSLNT